MRYVYLLNRLSLLYMIINTFSLILSKEIGQIQFLYYLIVLILAEAIRQRHGNGYISTILLLVPSISSKSFFELFLFICLSSLLIYVHNKEMPDYSLFVEKFENGLKIILGIVIIFSITLSFNILNNYISGFIIVYLTSGIILLRTLRNEETEKNTKDISKYNLVVNLSILTISILLSIENIRKYFFNILGFIYNKLIDLFFYLFYWLFFLIAIIFEQIRRLVYSAISNENINIITQKMGSEDAKKIAKEVMQNSSVNFTLAIFTKIFVFILFSFIVYKLVIKEKRVSHTKNQSYKEEREFLLDSNNNYIQKFASFIKPKDSNELIRFYYSKFISRLKRKIEIFPSDTSLSIKTKSDKFVDKEKNIAIREIYIKARYGFEKISDTEKNTFIKLIKELKISK